MDKKTSKSYGTTFFALALIVSIFFELYFILTDPYNYFMLIGIGIVVVITGYLTFDSIEKARRDEIARANEQSEMLIKANKAIYLATKRSTKEAEEWHVQSIKAMDMMMKNLISNEKEMVHHMIAKNEELTMKQIETSNADNGDMSSLIEQLSASNAKLAKEVQAAITVNELVKANADLVKNVREVLNSGTRSFNTDSLSDYVAASVADINMSAAQAPVMQTPVMPVQQAPVMQTPVMPVQQAPVMQAPVMPVQQVPVMEQPVMPVQQAPVMEQPIMEQPIVEAPVMEEPIIEAPIMEVPVMEQPIVEDLPAMDIPDTSNEAEETEFASAEDLTGIELPAPETIESVDEIEDKFNFETFDLPDTDEADNSMLEEPEVPSSEIINDVNMSQLESMVELEGETVAEEMPEELDKAMSTVDDNPNRQLTEEEIAALFASL